MTGWTTVVLVAWGALAFGAVYPWAYWPLFIVAAAAGIGGLYRASAATGHARPKALLLAIGCVAIAIALQLVPLPQSVLARLSPATDSLLQTYSLPYFAAMTTRDVAGRQPNHPLSLNPEASVRSLAFLVALTLLLIGLSRALHSEGGLRRLGRRLTAVGLLIALVAIVQRFAVTGQDVYGFWTPEQEGASPYGPFVNKHHYAGWMVMILSLAIGMVSAGIARGMRKVKPTWRDRMLWLSSPDASLLVLTIFASLVMGLSLVLSLSRSGITAFAFALVVSTWLAARRQSTVSRRAAGAVYLAVIVIFAVGWVGLDAIETHFQAASWDTVGGRLGIWRDTTRVTRDFPLTGTGLNTFGESMLYYQTVKKEKHVAQAHNDYLQLAAEGGLLVGIPIVVALFFFVREVRRRFREGVDDVTTYWIRVGATTGLVAIALQELVDFSLQMPGNALLFTVLAAIAIHHPAPKRLA